MNSTKSVESFCDSQRELLALEYEAELSESTQVLVSETPVELLNRGVALLGLVVSDLSSGLFGKSIVTFQHHLSHSRKHSDVTLPQTTISAGDIVGIFVDSFTAAPLLTGVVHACDSRSLKIVLDGDDDGPVLWEYPRFNIARIGSNVTHKRLMFTVSDLEKSNHSMLSVMFGETVSLASVSSADISLEADSLNGPQKLAVRNALSNSLITVILGPPGTGKTTTLAAYIAEAVRKDPGVKILACAPSNVAVDNLALRVKNAGVSKIVRVGHPTRVDDEMLRYTLDALVDLGDFKESCSDIRKDIHEILQSRKGYADLKILRKDLREREAKAIEQVVRQSNVIFATCNGSFNLVSRLMKTDPSFRFDVCVIDECAQGLEISSWIPILQSRKTILGGDHKQLSATVLSETAERRGLSVTLFERAFERLADVEGVVNTLTVQYRMNDKIMGWSNRQFYDNKLVAHDSVKNQTLTVPPGITLRLNGVNLNHLVENPFVFVDTAGVEGMSEEVSETATVSKSNLGEVAVVQRYLEMIEPVIKDSEISVITPYLKQAELIRARVASKHIEVSTVDSFQGRESDIVIISLVRSNPDRIVGFLADYRRINVAITRAKKQLLIVGDSETISSDKILRTLYDYSCEFGEVVSAATFVTETDVVSAPSMSGPRTVKREKHTTAKPYSKQDKIAVSSSIEKEAPNDSFERLKEELQNVPLDAKYFFPQTLSSSQRRFIHDLCDKQGISHGSTGEGVERKIWVFKKSPRKPEPVRVVASSPPPELMKEIPRPKTFVPKVKPEKVPEPPTKASKPDGVCPHASCLMSTKLVSLDCGLCRKFFCIAHATPEAHGCGDAAKQKARQQVRIDLAHMKSPPIIQGKGGVATQSVRNKMESKLESMRKERSVKKKNS